jgi:predicted nucleotidyltransferase
MGTHRPAIEKLCEKIGKRWNAIDAAANAAFDERKKIIGILSDHRLVPSDTSFVVFGSLARDEWTVGSDVDWTLLVDGMADPDHFKVAQEIRERFIEAKLQGPGPTETFGSLAFSHEIVHHIGGEADTNRNTTRRVLLLLESRAIGDQQAYERVIKSVLNRYLDNDLSFFSASGQRYKVPRFLLNDIVRYWRTMCVDYATKHRERQAAKWALRNVKLRLSRKLIFAAGMLTCFNWWLSEPSEATNLFEMPEHLEPLISHLRTHVRMTPLEILAEAVTRYAQPSTAERIFDAYDQFLSRMNDGEIRKHLAELRPKNSDIDEVFREFRSISNRFQQGLDEMFFDSPKIGELTRKYGIF